MKFDLPGISGGIKISFRSLTNFYFVYYFSFRFVSSDSQICSKLEDLGRYDHRSVQALQSQYIRFFKREDRRNEFKQIQPEDGRC